MKVLADERMNEMKMSEMQTMLFPGRYIQGKGAIGVLSEILDGFGEKPLILATRSMAGLAVEVLGEGAWVEGFSGECCREEIDRVEALARSGKASSLTAIGGGKVIDCCKIVADRLMLPVVVVPTIASTDAPCSGCAVVYTREGVFDHVHYQRHNPDVVLMDPSIIGKAPVRYLISGMGDALATFFEANSCSRSGSLNECGGGRTMTALAIARLCMDTILGSGRKAAGDVQKGLVTPEVEAVIEANTLLSGIGFESCGIAGAHSIHNGLTALAGTHGLFHGEKVAFGIVATLQLYDELEMMDVVYDFLMDVGLPVCFEDLGIGDVGTAELRVVAEHCCLEGSSMFHEPVEISPDILVDAMKKADALGRQKKLERASRC